MVCRISSPLRSVFWCPRLEGAYKVAVKSIDKAAAKGLLHKNNAAHKKSALTLKLNNIG